MLKNKFFNDTIDKILQLRFVVNYRRMWPYVKPFWFRALCSMLICIPIGSLDAVIALALKPYMDLVMVEKSIASPWYIPLGIVAFTSIQGGLKYMSSYLSTWVGGKITNGLKYDMFKKLLKSFFQKIHIFRRESPHIHGNIGFSIDRDQFSIFINCCTVRRLYDI